MTPGGARPGYSVDIVVPAGEWLTANGRLHWAQRARRTRRTRARAAYAARAARIPPMARARITVHVHGRTRVRTDPANSYPTVKAVVDGLVDAGVLPDDDASHLDGPDMRLGDPDPHLPTGAHRLTVDITQLSEPVTLSTETITDTTESE